VLANARRSVPQARILGVLVQPMAPRGREIILGVKRDATFGPLLMVGLGGVAVEVLKDVALAPVPLAPSDARAMLARLKGAALLDAYRGAAPADTDALVELMVRLGQFAADHAETITEIDLNPVLVHERGKGVSVVDALIVKRKQ
jgi:acetyltransferase